MRKILFAALLVAGTTLGFAKEVKRDTEKTPNTQTTNITNFLVKMRIRN